MMSAQTDKIEAGPRSGGAEHHDNDIDLKHEAVVLKSDHDELGLWATVCRFKKVVCSKIYKCSRLYSY